MKRLNKRPRGLASWFWFFPMILMVVSFPRLSTPILARTLHNSSLPTRILELTSLNSKLPTNQVLLPDWSRISLSQMPGITRSGSIDGSSYTQVLGYDLSRSWTAGMTPDEYLKLGDISQAFQAEVFSLKAISGITRINLEQSALSAFPLIAHQTLNHLAEVVPKLAQTPVKAISPVASFLTAKGIEGTTLTLGQVLTNYPQVGELQLGEIDLSEFSISSIPLLETVQIQEFEGWMNSFIKDIPGLGQVPLALMPNPITEASPNFVMRIDQVYSPQETHRINTISGSDVQGFSVPCTGQNCAYLELDDLENSGNKVRGTLEGKQWISGKYQEVEGGWGILKSVNDGKEPTGRLPFGSAFKVVVMEPDERTDTVDTALFFRFCADSWGCTPYFIGPVPFLNYRTNSLIFVGELPKHKLSASKKTPQQNIKNLAPTESHSNPQPSPVLSSVSGGGLEGVQGIDLKVLSQSLTFNPDSTAKSYQAVGVYTCAEGGINCGRKLGRYQLDSSNPYAVQLITAKKGGKEFLKGLEQGHKPTSAEVFQFFPPADQDRAFWSDLVNKIQSTKEQIDSTTGNGFKGDRLLERVAQKYYGGESSQIDGNGSDALGSLNLKDYGKAVLNRYKRSFSNNRLTHTVIGDGHE